MKLAALAAPFLPIPLEVVSHSSTRSMTDDSACSTRRKPNIFDNMMSMMEKYANNLEALVDERTEQLLEEKKKTGKIPFNSASFDSCRCSKCSSHQKMAPCVFINLPNPVDVEIYL